MQYIKQFIINLLLFSLAGITYATYTSVTSGDPLTASSWNSLLAKVDGIFTDGTGKVGIGNTAPTEKLDVTGNIKASGTVCDSSGCIGSGGSTFSCTEEFDYTETGSSIISYNPSPAKKAELMANGYICWNRMDDGVKVSPLDGYNFATGYYGVWIAPDYKVCGKINYIGDASKYILSWVPGYFFGLRYVDGVTNTLHGRWAAGGGETYGSLGTSDRWTIWTCK